VAGGVTRLRLREEDLLLRELEGREEAAEDADDRLEHRDARGAVEVEVLRHL